MPELSTWDRRLGENVRFYLSNYFAVAGCILVVVALSNVWAVLWSAILGVAFSVASRAIERNDLHFVVAGRRFGRNHLKLMFLIVGSLVLLYFIGDLVFIFLGATVLFVALHAALRVPPSARESSSDDEESEEAPARRSPTPSDTIPSRSQEPSGAEQRKPPRRGASDV